MMQGTWLFLAFGVALFWLSIRPALVKETRPLQMSWRWYAAAMFCHAGFTLFRVGNWDSPSNLQVVEMWSQGISWACLGVCTLFASTAMLGAAGSGEGGDAQAS